jgi:hypothetical protein
MLPALRSARTCVACGGPVASVSWTQLPLLRHGGYGEACRVDVERCGSPACGVARETGTAAVSPLVALRGEEIRPRRR